MTARRSLQGRRLTLSMSEHVAAHRCASCLSSRPAAVLCYLRLGTLGNDDQAFQFRARTLTEEVMGAEPVGGVAIRRRSAEHGIGARRSRGGLAAGARRGS